MKKLFAFILFAATINVANAHDPKKCSWQDANGNTYNGTVSSMTTSWEDKNGAGRSTNTSSAVSGQMEGNLAVVKGQTSATTTNSNSQNATSERNSTVSVTRDVCMDADNNYEAVNWSGGWR